MILNLYFARRFAVAFLFVIGAFSVLILLLDFIEHLRRFRGKEVAFGKIVQLVVLNVPATLYQMLPLVMVLCSIMLFLSLARSSELIVARAAGRSALRALTGPLLTSLTIGILAVVVVNPIVASTQKQYETLASSFFSSQVSTVSISANGLWLRQGNDKAQIVIHAERANLDGTQLYDVALYEFDLSGKATRRVAAQTATLREGHWNLLNVKEWPLQSGGNPEADADQMRQYQVPTELTKEHIHDSFGTPALDPNLATARVHSTAGASGFFSTAPSGLVSNGIGFASIFGLGCNDWRRFHHAERTAKPHRASRIDDSPIWLWSLFPTKFCANFRGKRPIA